MAQYPSFFGNYSNDIFFLLGRHSAQTYFKSNNIRENVLISGYSYPDNVENVENNVKKIKEDLLANGAKYIILLIDNAHDVNQSWNKYIHTPVLNEYYKEHLQWLIEDEEVGLIIKSKNSIYLDNLPEIRPLLEKAVKTGRCYNVQDPFGIQVSYFGDVSDIVVATGVYISGALIECVQKGTRGVSFDYPNLKSSENVLYEWGEGKVFFKNLRNMMVQLKLFKVAPDNNTEFGDWSRHIAEIEPFRDGQGGRRVGEYLLNLQQGFERK